MSTPSSPLVEQQQKPEPAAAVEAEPVTGKGSILPPDEKEQQSPSPQLPAASGGDFTLGEESVLVQLQENGGGGGEKPSARSLAAALSKIAGHAIHKRLVNPILYALERKGLAKYTADDNGTTRVWRARKHTHKEKSDKSLPNDDGNSSSSVKGGGSKSRKRELKKIKKDLKKERKQDKKRKRRESRSSGSMMAVDDEEPPPVEKEDDRIILMADLSNISDKAPPFRCADHVEVHTFSHSSDNGHTQPLLPITASMLQLHYVPAALRHKNATDLALVWKMSELCQTSRGSLKFVVATRNVEFLQSLPAVVPASHSVQFIAGWEEWCALQPLLLLPTAIAPVITTPLLPPPLLTTATLLPPPLLTTAAESSSSATSSSSQAVFVDMPPLESGDV